MKHETMLTLRPTDPNAEHAAALMACAYAADITDARNLMHALGVLPDPTTPIRRRSHR